MPTQIKRKEFNPQKEYYSILTREGLSSQTPTRLSIQKLHKSSIFLFKHILAKGDPRWRIVYLHANLSSMSSRKFSRDLEFALQSEYASKSKSKRRQYGKTSSEDSLLQYIRALKNIELGTKFLPKDFSIANKYNIKFQKTRFIEKDKTNQNVTGCPEALWQMQLWQGKKYLGRIGFNFHIENEKIILTIANIQGAKGKKTEIDTFAKNTGNPNNFAVSLISDLKSKLPLNVEFRGLKPKKEDRNKVLYTMTFRKTKIPTFSQ